MNGLDLQTALGYVDLELAEAAAAPPQRKHRPWKRLAAIAACVCLLLAGTALAGEKLFGVSILNMITGRQESSYQVLADVKQFSPEEFSSPDLESALEEARQQYGTYQPWDSQLPGWSGAWLDTWEACEEFLGREIFNPLEGVEGLEPLSSSATPLSAHPHCEVRVNANESGRLNYAALDTCYETETCKISLTVHFFMEGGTVRPEMGVVYDGVAEFGTDQRTLSSGQEALLMRARQEDAKYSELDAYFVQDGALYDLRVWRWAPAEEEAERIRPVEETLDALLALF